MTFAKAKFKRFLPAAMFAMSVEVIVCIAGGIVCGQIVGENGLSAVNLMQPVMGLVAFFALLTGTGTSVLYSTEMGRSERRRASELLTQGLWNALLSGFALCALLAASRDLACGMFGVSGAVLAGFREFWLWYLPCAFLKPLVYYFSSVCYADGDGKTCVLAYLAQLVGNCAIAIPLTMKFGLAGCAFGMGLWQLAALAILLGHLRKRENSLKFAKWFSFGDMFRIWRCAAGDASMKICQSGLFLALDLYVVARYGEAVLPVLAVVIAIVSLGEVFDGISTAVQPLASVYIGEGNDRLVRRIMVYAAKTAAWAGLGLTLLLLVFPGVAVSLVGIKDPALAGMAVVAVRIVAFSLMGSAFVMLLNSYYTFIAREGLATMLTVLAVFVVPCVLGPALDALVGRAGIGIWTALAISPYLALALAALFIRSRYGCSNWPLFLSRKRERNIRVYDLELSEGGICKTAASIEKYLRIRQGMNERRAGLSSLLVEETLMTVAERNRGRKITSEISIDRNEELSIVIRDDGEIFDITDADAKICSLRTYLVANIMVALPARRNMTIAGFNRNAYTL